jgi:hypothetical protein
VKALSPTESAISSIHRRKHNPHNSFLTEEETTDPGSRRYSTVQHFFFLVRRKLLGKPAFPLFFFFFLLNLTSTNTSMMRKKTNVFEKKSSGRVLLINFLEVVLMFKSSVVLSLLESVESVLKTDRLAVVSCVRICRKKIQNVSANRVNEAKKNILVDFSSRIWCNFWINRFRLNLAPFQQTQNSKQTQSHCRSQTNHKSGDTSSGA